MDGSGLGVAVVTPFDEDGSLDLYALKRLIKHLLKGPVDYLVALGTTGEASTQRLEEKLFFLEQVFEQVEGRCPIVVGAGGNNTSAVVAEMETYAKRFPVAAFLSVTPYYNKPTQAGLYAHYAALAKNAPAPIFLYNVPSRTGVNLTAEVTLQLAWEYPCIVGVKEASGDLMQGMEILRQAPPRFQVILGEDALLVPALAIGYSGVISVLGNALPAALQEIFQAAHRKDYEAARQWHLALLPLIRLCFAEGNPTGIKALLHEMGLTQPYVRLPLVPASDKLFQQIRQALRGIPASSFLDNVTALE
ncbi:MAG: 4-hydroxy-tetrahydrodipicolinate synthase [Bacteroidia bacterium]